MKHVLSILALALILAGCSPKGDGSASQSPPSLAADLGKMGDYYRNLYGAPKTEAKAGQFDFPLPAHEGISSGMFRITGPLIVQQYQTEKLRAVVVLSETTRRAIWVKYTLSTSLPQEQFNAALAVYGSNWKIVQQEAAMSLLMPSFAPVVYRSSTAALAYKTMSFELMVYAPQLYANLKTQAEEAERQRRVPPKF